MCGIAGLYRTEKLTKAVIKDAIQKMSHRLEHRGPDSGGQWFDHEAGLAFGHRRLAIIDTSNAGHQPMVSGSGRYVITLNGEIYNHLELREQLGLCAAPVDWRGHSDTETLLAGFDHWGIEKTLMQCVGMFALALWDRQERVLTLARDRLGEKPLYYSWQNGVFVFASELKALRVCPGFSAEIDSDVLADYFRYNYISAPHSIYKNVYKLLPGTYIQLKSDQPIGDTPAPTEYWSLQNVMQNGLRSPFDGTDQEATDMLELHLKESINLQRIADVPLGAFLSGGIDSSTMVALMQGASSRPVQTFTIGFEESGFNEAIHARAVATHLGTEHSELYVTSKQAMDVIPSLPQHYDEPFGDSSAIPTLLVSKLARNKVTVSISGDGGDELFGGYTRYQKTLDSWSRLRRVPLALRRAAASVIKPLCTVSKRSTLAVRGHRLARYLAAPAWAEMYDVRVSQCADSEHWIKASPERLKRRHSLPDFLNQDDRALEAMLYKDMITYLPDDILAKVDRASMAVSLESRVPMLNHNVVEFAWSLPQHMKVRDGQSKWLLKQVLNRHVPKALTDRPKMGFGVPVEDWIRGPLRDWAEEQLSERRLKQEGFLEVEKVRGMWQRHVDNRGSSGASVWNILMFQSWLETQNSL